MSNRLFSIALLFLFVSCVSTKPDVATTKDIVWTLGGFERPNAVNPIILPDSNSTFMDPMSDSLLRWEENDTF